MGYDIHITRAKRWDDSGRRPVLAHEWQACVSADDELERADGVEARTAHSAAKDEELAVWRLHPSGVPVLFRYSGGQILVERPDEPTVAKALAVARRLNAWVQGDDGETLDDASPAPRAAALSLVQRWTAWRDRWWRSQASPPIAPPFAPGDRVRDPWHREGSVLAVDVAANHGLGLVRVQWDDGREIAYTAVGHGLTRSESTHGRASAPGAHGV